MSAAEGASEASSPEQANEKALRANDRTDERVAQYFSLYFWLFSTIVRQFLVTRLYRSPCWSVRLYVNMSHFAFLSRAPRPKSHRVGPSVTLCVRRHTLLFFFAFLSILRVGKFVFEHAPAQIITAPTQSITAPAQITTAPAQLPATGVVVYMALFLNDPLS